MSENQSDKVKWGEMFFKYRDYTPIPLILLLIIFAKPTVFSATIGLMLVFFGELLRIYSVAFIGSISRTRKGSLGAKLVTSGPFQLVRNPLYVANFFISLGFTVFGNVGWILVAMVILFIVQYFLIVAYEETLLFDQFGQSFDEYKSRVPAWVPKKLPPLVEVEWPESFSPALKSERRTLTTIFVLLAVLVVF